MFSNNDPAWLTSLSLVPWALLRLGLIIVTCVGAGCWWPRVTLLRSHTLTAILYSAILGIGILGSLTAVLGYCHLLTLNFILPLAAASFASGVLYLLATIRGADHPIRMVADLRFMRRHIRHKHRSQSIRAVRRRVVPSDRWSWLHYSLFAVTAILLLYMLLGALAPDSQQDSQWYHLSVARALQQISDYSRQLDLKESNPEKKVAEFISFLPVLAFDGSSMRQINAQEVLDIAMAGTSATLLAKRWESALLVNVDNETLKRLMDNKEALAALMRIEGFRSLNSDIATIINKSEKVKKAKKESDKKLTAEEKKELSAEEKEYKTMRKQIQEKLIKFATRIPVFMYLTDYRERSLKDVITQLEPKLFKKVTGLDVKDFELLCSINVFNSNLMNDAIFKFKRYEDASLSYTGIDRHSKDETVGGWDTSIRREDYEREFYNQPGITKKTETVNEPEEEYLPKSRATLPARKPEERKSSVPEIEVGMLVMHKKHGKGKIVSITNKGTNFKVAFKKSTERFIYPNAFQDKHLQSELRVES